MKFIHAADIHLDSPMHRLPTYEGVPVERIRQATRRAFEHLIDLALGEPVDFVLIAGDLFDGDWRDYNTGLYFISQVRRLSDAGIPMFIVAGNHDAAGRMTRSLPFPKAIHLFSHRNTETRTIEALRLAVHGQSFSSATVMENLAAGYPEPLTGYFNIGLLHTGLTGRPGHEPYAPCSADDLINKGYDYWALGHVHRFETVRDDPPVVFPGCIQGRHIKETGERGCALVTVQADRRVTVERYHLDVIRWAQVPVDLTGVETMEAAMGRFYQSLSPVIQRHGPLPVIARVVFTGRTGLHARLVADPAYLRESVRSTAMGHFAEKAWIQDVRIETHPRAQPALDPGPLGELEMVVNQVVSDEGELAAMGDALANLFQKLPADYRQGSSRIQPDDTDQLRELVLAAHTLLTQRLTRSDDRS